MTMILNTFTILAALTCSTIFGGNLFDVIVNEKNLINGFPESITHIRNYYKFRNPGHFFKYLTPVYLVFAILALILSFNISKVKFILILFPVVSYAITQLITFIYFFPQNRILRESPISEVQNLMKELSTKRTYLDLIRNFFTVSSIILLMISLFE